MINYNIINGHTLVDSPTIQCGVLITKTISAESNHEIYRTDTLHDTTMFLLYKRISMPGEPELWSIPFNYIKYGESLKECAIRACNEYLKFPLMEEMLEQHKTLLDRTIIDDKHTGQNFNYSPLTFLYTYQVESDEDMNFITLLYNKVKETDLNREDSSDIYKRAIYLTDRYLTNNKIRSYKPEENINHSKVADIGWFTLSEVRELIKNNGLDNSTKWIMEQKIKSMIF